MSDGSEKQGTSADAPVVVTFVRHAQAVQQGDHVRPNPWNPSEYRDPPLSEMGKRQVERLAKRLLKEKFEHIYSSDLLRAFDTVRAVLRSHPDTPFTVSKDLHEITNYHFLPGPIPDVPMIRECVNMERDAVLRFVNRLRHSHQGGDNVLVVAHGNLIRTMIPVLAGRNPKEVVLMEINNTSVTVVDVWLSGEGILKLANCVAHLLPKQVT